MQCVVGREPIFSAAYVNFYELAVNINEQEEATMQRRTCECGRDIWVQYKMQAGGCRPVFWSVTRHAGRTIHVCPSCGSFLHIDALS